MKLRHLERLSPDRARMTPSHRTTRHCTGRGALATFLLLAALPRAGHTDPAPTWQEVTVSTLRGSGTLPVLVSGDWTQPEPEITRVVITVHGERRDAYAYAYNAIAHDALARAGVSGRGTLLVTPRFPNQDDPTPGNLFWPGNGWIDGMDAASPAALGSFDAIDALIARLSDRRLFPSLASIVLVGHSAGGQFVQRYAELTQAEARAAEFGIILRYVIANPSSYSYFTIDRPTQRAASRLIRSTSATASINGSTGWSSVPPMLATSPPQTSSTTTCGATSPTCWAVATPTRLWQRSTGPALPRRKGRATSSAAVPSSATCSCAIRTTCGSICTRSTASDTMRTACSRLPAHWPRCSTRRPATRARQSRSRGLRPMPARPCPQQRLPQHHFQRPPYPRHIRCRHPPTTRSTIHARYRRGRSSAPDRRHPA